MPRLSRHNSTKKPPVGNFGRLLAKHDAPWLKRSKGVSGADEIRVVDLDRGVERPATPEEISNGVEYRDYDHFKEGRAA
jgi:hypothetical protein